MTTNLYDEAAHAYRSGRWSDAARLYEHLANEGDVQAQVFAGWILVGCPPEYQDLGRARHWLELAATRGDMSAELYLGRLCELENKHSEAVQWFRRSASKGSAGSHYWLGRKLARGELVAERPDEAVLHLRAAMRLGHIFARKEYGLLLIRQGGFGGRLHGLALVAWAMVEGTIRAFVNPHDTRLQI